MFQLLGGTLTAISKSFLGSLHYSGLVVKNLCDGILMGTRFVSLYPIFVVKFMKSFKFAWIKSSTVHVYDFFLPYNLLVENTAEHCGLLIV